MDEEGGAARARRRNLYHGSGWLTYVGPRKGKVWTMSIFWTDKSLYQIFHFEGTHLKLTCCLCGPPLFIFLSETKKKTK